MGVGIKGHADIGVSQPLLNDLRMGTVFKKQGCVRVSQVMEANAIESDATCDLYESVANSTRQDRRPIRMREDQRIRSDGHTGKQAFDLLVLLVFT